VLEPCGDKVEHLQGVEGLVLSRFIPSQSPTERILFQTREAFYLLQPGAKQLQRIPGVQPTPYDAHSDSAAWSPHGERLAIAHLNSRDPKDGITLYLIDGATAQVSASQALDLASEQSAPFIEWLNNEKLLLHGPNALIMLDFSTTPPRQVNVIRDLFHLTLAYPDQVSSMSSVTALDGSGYHLLVWANLPADQRLYIYHSENDQLSVLRPRSPAILVFPDGQWERMTQLQPNLPTADQVEFDWVDSTAAPLTIPISGHLPRGYPSLDVRYLPQTSRLLLASSNGVSLLSFPEGELLHFWETGSGRDTAPWLNLSPDEKTALISVQWDGLFSIPISK
jgi:hypothetical protein